MIQMPARHAAASPVWHFRSKVGSMPIRISFADVAQGVAHLAKTVLRRISP